MDSVPVQGPRRGKIRTREKRSRRKSGSTAAALQGLFALMQKHCIVRAVDGPEDMLRFLETRTYSKTITLKPKTNPSNPPETVEHEKKQPPFRLEECASSNYLKQLTSSRSATDEVIFDYHSMSKGFERERERSWFAGMACLRRPSELEYERTCLKVARSKRALERELPSWTSRLTAQDKDENTEDTSIDIPSMVRYNWTEDDVKSRHENLWGKSGSLNFTPPNDDHWSPLMDYNAGRAGLEAFIRDAAYAMKVSNKIVESRKTRTFKAPSDSITEIAWRSLNQLEKKSNGAPSTSKSNVRDSSGKNHKRESEVNARENKIKSIVTGRIPFTIRHLGAMLLSATSLASSSKDILSTLLTDQLREEQKKKVVQEQSLMTLANGNPLGTLIDTFNDNWMSISESKWTQQMDKAARLFSHDSCISSVLNIHSGQTLCPKCVHALLEGANKAPGCSGQSDSAPLMSLRRLPSELSKSGKISNNANILNSALSDRRTHLNDLKVLLFKQWVEHKVNQEAFEVRRELNMIEYGFQRSMLGPVSFSCMKEISIPNGLAETGARFEQWWQQCVFERLPDVWRPYVISPQYRFSAAFEAKPSVETHACPSLFQKEDGTTMSLSHEDYLPDCNGANNVLFLGGISSSVPYSIDMFREFVAVIEYIRLRTMAEKPDNSSRQKPKKVTNVDDFKIGEVGQEDVKQAEVLVSPAIEDEEILTIYRTPVDFSKDRTQTEPLGRRRHVTIRRAGLVTLDGCVFAPYWTKPRSLAALGKKCPKSFSQSCCGGFPLTYRCAQLSRCESGSPLKALMQKLNDPLRWSKNPRTAEITETENNEKDILAVADILRRRPKTFEPRSDIDHSIEIKPRISSKVNVYIKGSSEAIKILYDLCNLLRSVCAISLLRICWDCILPDSNELNEEKLESKLKGVWESGTYLEDMIQSNHHNLEEMWCSSYDELFASLGIPFGPEIDTLWRISLNAKLDIEPGLADERISKLKIMIIRIWRRVQKRRKGQDKEKCPDNYDHQYDADSYSSDSGLELNLLEITEEELFLTSFGSLHLNDSYLSQFHHSWNLVSKEVFSLTHS